MARRKLSNEEQLVGVNAALRSPRTPPQLKAGLKRRKEVLEKAVGRSTEKQQKRKRGSFFESFFTY